MVLITHTKNITEQGINYKIVKSYKNMGKFQVYNKK